MQSISATKIVAAIIKRDIKLALRRGSDTSGVIFFFILVVSLFPLALGADNKEQIKIYSHMGVRQCVPVTCNLV